MTMTDADLIGYLLDALDDDDRVAVESHLRANPDAAARLEQLRLTLAPLEADREPDPVPAGLALRTIGRLAEYLVEHEPTPARPSSVADLVATVEAATAAAPEVAEADEPLAFPAATGPIPRAPREEPETRAIGGRFRPDLLVACGIALFAGGLIFSAVGKVRAQNQMLACQNALRVTHTGLSGYADANQGRYPQVGPNATADSFAAALASAGQVPVGFRPACPACPVPTPVTPTVAVGYTYTLGYYSPTGDLLGLRRPTATPAEHDLVPICADYPTADAAPAAGPVCPHPRGMNVLFVGGHVRFTRTPLIGPNGDHIFQNVHGRPEAGADRSDVVLGRPGDRP
jgi:prepilin-type processing-associated H-X9-DG protein